MPGARVSRGAQANSPCAAFDLFRRRVLLRLRQSRAPRPSVIMPPLGGSLGSVKAAKVLRNVFAQFCRDSRADSLPPINVIVAAI